MPHLLASISVAFASKTRLRTSSFSPETELHDQHNIRNGRAPTCQARHPNRGLTGRLEVPDIRFVFGGFGQEVEDAAFRSVESNSSQVLIVTINPIRMHSPAITAKVVGVILISSLDLDLAIDSHFAVGKRQGYGKREESVTDGLVTIDVLSRDRSFLKSN